jgi:putative MFS transporter
MHSSTDARVLKHETVSSIIEQLSLSKFHYYVVLAAGFGYMFDSFDTYLVAYAMPAVIRDWHITAVMTGMLTSAGMWGTFFGAIVWGPPTDKWGRKFGFAATVLGFSLVSAFTAFARNPTEFMICRFLTGLCLGGELPIVSTMVAEYISVKHRGRFVAVLTVMWPFGLLAAAFCALGMIPRWGWRPLFIVGALPAFLAFVIRRGVPESPRWLAIKGRTDEAKAVLKKLGATDEQLKTIMQEEVTGTVPFSTLLRKPYLKRFIATAGAFFFAYVGYYGYSLWLPTILVTVYNLSLVKTFTYTLCVACASILGKLTSFYTIERFGRLQVFYVGYGLGGVVALLFGLIKDPAYLLGTACVLGYLLEIGVAGNIVWTPELYPSKIRGTANNWSAAAGKLSAAAAPLLFGYFLARHFYYGIWLTMAICFAITIALVATLGIETKGKTLEEIGAA